MKPVTISDPAREELRDAVRWYRERDERVAARFTAETRRILKLIDRFPNLGSRVPGIDDLAVRRMPVHNFPYHVVFVDLGDHIEVAAFAHKRRRPEYLLERLSRYWKLLVGEAGWSPPYVDFTSSIVDFTSSIVNFTRNNVDFTSNNVKSTLNNVKSTSNNVIFRSNNVDFTR